METPSPSPDDAALVRRVVEHDQQAFTLLYDRHSSLLYSIALNILADPEEARDILQQVFLILHEKAGSYDPALGRPAAWLASIARNRSIDRVRQLKRQREYAGRVLAMAEASRTIPAPGGTPDQDEIAYLHAAVAGLPEDQRQALQLAYFSGLTQQEIADTLGHPLGTVKARIRRALLKLREALHGILN